MCSIIADYSYYVLQSAGAGFEEGGGGRRKNVRKEPELQRTLYVLVADIDRYVERV